MPHKRGVEAAHEVRGTDQQHALAVAKVGHNLEQLVRDALRGGRRVTALRCDLLHLVDEDDPVLQLPDPLEHAAQRRRHRTLAIAQPGRKHLDEWPVEPRRDRLRKRGFSRARRPEQHHRARWYHPIAVGEIRLRERSNQPLLEQLLLAPHASDVFPQVPGQNAPAHILE